MPGNGRKWNPSISLMQNRMWGKTPREEYLTHHVGNWTVAPDGIGSQFHVITSNGGFHQQDRMIFDKRRSFDRALVYSYQGANIQKVSSEEDKKCFPVCRALINPNKLKQDYDDKILSVHKEDNFKPGDVFKWMNTNTYWLIYLQDLTELAYFRGDIRKCSYQINWVDEDGEHSAYAAIRGPVETKINYIQKHKISVDTPNHSLNILLPKNKETLSYFKRYSKFYLNSEEIQPSNVCWRVEAIDWISMEGVLEINATEYYSNETEDDLEKGLVGSLIVKEPEPDHSKDLIIGDDFIKPKKEYVYKYIGYKVPGEWTVDKKVPVKLTVNPEDKREVSIKWTSSYSGQFDLSLGDETKTIVVESLF